MRLVVSSNSVPRWDPEAGLLPRSPGGLVPLLVTLLGENGGDWICTSPPGEPDPGDGVRELPGDVRLHQVWLPDDVREQHYLTIGVRLMLWLFHHLFDTSHEPSFDASFARAWAGYEAANRAHAERLRKVSTGEADEVLLINDYHLFLVPALLPEERRNRVVYVHGLPWCPAEYFGMLPAHVREPILASLLRCDVVAFHSSRWAAAFLDCCVRLLPGAVVAGDRVEYRGRTTSVAVATFPLDGPTLTRLDGEEATQRWRSRLAGPAAGRRVLARADRLDLWKNQPRGFAAYRALLEADPGLVDEWWFCAVATVPSRTTERSRAWREHCESMVADVNERFGRPGRPAVSLVYPDGATSRNCVTAALTGAAAVIVNPTWDGMNLVAKEALFLADRAPVLLSENAGAYEHVASWVTPVQPFDVTGTSRALGAALAGSGSAAGTAEVRAALTGRGASGWLEEHVNHS
jgi:trehalose 6-phosphate synthase